MLLSNRGVTGTTRIALDYESIRNIPIPELTMDKQNVLVNLWRTAVEKHAAKLREADELLAGVDRFILERLGIGEIPIQRRIAVTVTLGTVKADNTIGAEYYHPERLTVICSLENNTALSTRRLVESVEFLRNIVPADNGEPYLGLSGVASNTGELSGVQEEVKGQAFDYKAGDVLYARLRPYLNKVLYAETDGICSTEFHVLRVNCNDVLPEYLAAVLRSKIIVLQTKHMMTGNTHPRISNDDVRNLRIPIPSVKMQCTIVDDIRKRVEQARRLKQEAEAGWSAAKEQFERELIGE